MQKVAEGDLEGAVTAVEALQKENPTNPFVGGVLGGLYTEAGRPGEALNLLQPIADRPDADPAVLYNAGRAAAALGRLQMAGEYLMRAEALQPGSPAGRELGLLMARFDQLNVAYPYLTAWASSHPEDLEVNRVAALVAVQLDRAPEAERFLAVLPQADKRVQLLWGEVLLKKGDPNGALGFLEPLVGDVPEEMEVDLRRTLARAQVAVGEADAAVEQLRLVRDKVGASPSLALQLGDALLQAGKTVDAIETLAPFAAPLADVALPEDPPAIGVEILVEYGRALQLAGRSEDAVKYLALATQAAPDRKAAWQSYGQALAATGERDKARVALERFQELNRAQEDDIASVNRLRDDAIDPTGRAVREAIDLAEAGDLDAALDRLANESVLSPNDPRPALMASRLLLQSNRIEEALAAAERAIGIAPGSPDTHYQKAVVVMAKKELVEAEALFQKALEIFPDHTPALNDFAVLLLGQNRTDEARQLLERALELNPNDSLARQNLERLGGN